MEASDIWLNDDFEDALLQSMILKDCALKVQPTKNQYKYPASHRISNEDFRNFSGSDIFLPTNINGEFFLNSVGLRHGLPNKISQLVFVPSHSDDSVIVAHGINIARLPKGILRTSPGKIFSHSIFSLIKNELYGEKHFYSIDSDGVVHDCEIQSHKGYVHRPLDLRGNLHETWMGGDCMFNPDYPVTNNGALFCMLLQEHDEMLDGWIVNTKHANNIVKMGVNLEQLKSIFYSLTTDLTGSGRRSPFIHWVQSHKRRIKSGIDIDVKKHLRGAEKFHCNGIEFVITGTGKGM